MMTLFLSASVPALERAERFRRGPHAAFEIEQAVISLSRALFARGGRLVFGGHPTISPLVAIVAGEYRKPRRAESRDSPEPESVVIYQSEAYRDVAQEATLLIYQLDAASVVWTEAIGGERFDPDQRGAPQCKRSLEVMRRRMLKETNPQAMVCIGGMEGVLEEAKLFEELFPNRNVYVLKATGGAAAELAVTSHDRVKLLEPDLLADVARLRAATISDAAQPDEVKRRDYDERPATPYPLIFQTLVAELMKGSDRG